MASKEWLKKKLVTSNVREYKKKNIAMNTEIIYSSTMKNCQFSKEKRNI